MPAHRHAIEQASSNRSAHRRSEPLDPYLRAMGLADMAVAGNRQKEETTPTFYDIRQTTTTLGQRKVNWFGESSRLLEFDRPLTEPGASKLTKVFLARRTAVWNQASGAPRHRRDIGHHCDGFGSTALP